MRNKQEKTIGCKSINGKCCSLKQATSHSVKRKH